MERLTLCLTALLLAATAGADCGHPTQHDNPEIRGLWWCDDPPTPSDPPPEKKPAEPPAPPPRYSHAQLMAMHPDQLEPLLKEHRRWAAYTLAPDDVEYHYRVQDVTRRKSAAFAAVSEVVMLRHPELSGRSAFQTTNAGDLADARQEEAIMNRTLHRYRDRYALGLFVHPGCPHCQVALGELHRFQQRTGWRLEVIDIEQRPELAARFHVTTTPLLMLVEKQGQSGQGFPIAVGVQPLPNIRQTLYATLRLLNHEISPEQFFTHEGQQGGFFDPKASAPAHATGRPSP